LYLDRNGVELNDLLNTTSVPLNQLTEAELCPGSSVLDEINQGYR
jgi:2-oxoglutarate/2-oxoacid ferredoxin oxidoreductase subunit beta